MHSLSVTKHSTNLSHTQRRRRTIIRFINIIIIIAMQKSNQLFLAFLTIAIFITCTSIAKQRPEGGWLWKISGNGLSHPSYLFGTYHGTYDILYQYTDSIPELHQAFNACSQFAGESETTSKPTLLRSEPL